MHCKRCAMAWWCLIGVFVTLAIPFASAIEPITEWKQGTGKHFGGPQEVVIDPHNPRVNIGGCSYGELNPSNYPFYNVASFHPDSPFFYNSSMGGCGACFEVQCADEPDKCVNGPLTNNIVVVNSGTCGTGCTNHQVNLHVFAFDKLAPIRLGNIKIRLRQVKCQPLDYLVIRVKAFRRDAGGYLKLVIRNIPGDAGLTNVELKGSNDDGGWNSFQNFWGAAWEVSELPEPPFDLRLTGTEGQQVTLKSVINQDTDTTKDIYTKQTFPGYDPFPAPSKETNSAKPALPPGPPTPPSAVDISRQPSFPSGTRQAVQQTVPPGGARGQQQSVPPGGARGQQQSVPPGGSGVQQTVPPTVPPGGSRGQQTVPPTVPPGGSRGQPSLPPIEVPAPPGPLPLSSTRQPPSTDDTEQPDRPFVDLNELSRIQISGGGEDEDTEKGKGEGGGD